MHHYFDIGSTHEFPTWFTSCKKDCCTRGIHGGRKGAVLDQHGGSETEMEAEIRCVRTGRTPREMDRDVDTGTSELEGVLCRRKCCCQGELRSLEDRDRQGRGRSRERRMHRSPPVFEIGACTQTTPTTVLTSQTSMTTTTTDGNDDNDARPCACVVNAPAPRSSHPRVDCPGGRRGTTGWWPARRPSNFCERDLRGARGGDVRPGVPLV